MADDLARIDEFSEQGRGVPIALSRPAGALPFSPLVRQAYAPAPRVRLGWGQGEIRVAEVPLDPPHALAPSDTLAAAAARMRADESDYAPVADAAGRFLGVVFVEDVLRCVADGQAPPDLRKLISTQIPTCAPRSALVDAVRQMIACWLRRIPVVGDDGALLGMLSLSAAAAASERDPSVRDVIESATTPALFARRWR